jgi:hypothetical protein
MNRASIRALASQHTLPGGTYRGTLQGLANVCFFSRMRYKMFLKMGVPGYLNITVLWEPC